MRNPLHAVALFRRALYLFLLACATLWSGPTAAISLTPAQLQQLQKLSPAEKAALAKQAGVALPRQGKAALASPTRTSTRSERAATVPARAPSPQPPSELERQYNARLGAKSTSPANITDGQERPLREGSHKGATLGRKEGFPSDRTRGGGRRGLIQSQPDLKNSENHVINAIPELGGNANDARLREDLQQRVGGKARAVHQRLRQFGYAMFARATNSFVPESAIPVPAEYVLGPGDEIHVQYYGRRGDSLSLVIDRDGVVDLPDVGAIPLAGMRYREAKAELSRRIRRALIGVTASISMGRLRTIRVFVLGDVRAPGSYVVGGLSTISHALFAAGGISKKGSLRHVRLKRGGHVMRELDLYQLMLYGNRVNDVRLMPGDVVFVPPIGKTAAVAAQVVRPAIYELRGEYDVGDLVRLAGGFLPDADRAHAQIDRLRDGDRTVLDVDLSRGHGSMRLHNGDLLMVYAGGGEREHVVHLLGRVRRPGDYGFHAGMRLHDLIRSRADLEDDAFLDYVLIQRTRADQTLVLLRAPLGRLLAGDAAANVPLRDKDRVFVLSRAAISPLKQVSVSGEVVSPGSYPLTQGMHVADLLLAAGGPTERAYLKQAEITRYRVEHGEKRAVEHFDVDLAAALAGDARANVRLMPDDVLAVRRISNWREAEHVTLRGEVRFPGTYPVEEGEHLSSLLERAGGFTAKAYLPAAVFTRVSIREEQQKQLQQLAREMEADIERQAASLSNIKDASILKRQQRDLELAKVMLRKMRQARATGRLVIRLTDLKHFKGSDFDLRLRDGDTLYIPQQPDQVLVLGQVYNQTAFLYRHDFSPSNYVDLAGGPRRFADTGRIYVIRANGEVDAHHSAWRRKRVFPGDTIVVPEKLEQFHLVDSLLDWSRILANVGVSIASFKAVGVL